MIYPLPDAPLTRAEKKRPRNEFVKMKIEERGLVGSREIQAKMEKAFKLGQQHGKNLAKLEMQNIQSYNDTLLAKIKALQQIIEDIYMKKEPKEVESEDENMEEK